MQILAADGSLFPFDPGSENSGMLRYQTGAVRLL